jgi:hypothetical protein
MGFARPTRSEAGKEYFSPRNHEDALVAFKVIAYDENHDTGRYGVKPVVLADVTIVRGEGAGAVYPRAEIGWDQLSYALHDHVGEVVLGRLVRGQQGGRPFLLNEASLEDEDYATEFLSGGQTRVDTRDPWETGGSTPSTGSSNPFDDPPF